MIDLQNIVKIYKLGDVEVIALDGVTCRIKAGEMVSIMGPSGSGKSTLMNLVGCLDRPTSGQYLLDGKDVSNLKDDELAEIRNKKIGFVFQSFNLLPQATTVANVALPLVYSGVDNKHERALEALELVGMGQRAKHRPSEISGGEQQRVAIARALVNNPALILADEPTGNLDTQTSKGIMLLLKRLNSQGITIVLVTHEVDIAAYTNRTIHLRDGKIISEKKR
ncbi:MAG: ABC transporter ATP-binding protein [Dehalococcoidia bacterium]|nr:ABC transporter ATP-binding protein [Dehalococcoidia bacterium]